MARHPVFCTEEIPITQIGENSAYSYRDGVISVYRKGHLVHEEKANYGDAFSILCYKGRTILKKMIPPTKKTDLVAWLLGFPKESRSRSYEEYERKIQKYYQANEEYLADNAEWEVTGSSYMLCACKRKTGDTNYGIACFICEAISLNEILELVPQMIYPEWYTYKILAENFNVTKEDFAKALNKT